MRAFSRNRFVGNVLIAVGALLPGIGGAFTRFGYTEVLHVTEFIGLALIVLGYQFAVSSTHDHGDALARIPLGVGRQSLSGDGE